MEVKYLNLPAQFNNNTELKKKLDGIFQSCQFILGPELEEFERDFAKLCGTKYAVGVDNGTNALFLALHAVGVGLGDEVITVPNSFLATVGAIVQAGAFPKLVDVSEDYNIDPERIAGAITKKTKAIIPVHLTGNPARMNEINKIAVKFGLAVIEDACQAVDASLDGRKTGSLGDLGAFSLHPLKNLNTCGDGGVLTTDEEKLYDELCMLRNHGLKNRNEAGFFAYNFRLDSIKAAVADIQIRDIAGVTNKRNEFARRYDAGFSKVEQISIPSRRPGVRQAFHTYIIQAEKRDELMKYLEEKRVETKIHYPIPIHLMEAAKRFGYKKGDFPIAEKQAERIISLPINQFLTKGQIDYVIEKTCEFYGSR